MTSPTDSDPLESPAAEIPPEPRGEPIRPLIAESVDTMRVTLAHARRDDAVIGVVPTMGALHEGHLSLMRQARDECDFVVATIFVNPTQFGPNEDFDRYPRTWDADLQHCRDAGVDAIFHPPREVMYPPGFLTTVHVAELTTLWEGRHRPGHFDGVTTVVLKLLNIVQPDIAFFGRKDYQQQLLIRRMCEDLDLPVEIRTCPTVREPDGLAMSSRNRYLTPEQRESALSLSQALRRAEEQIHAGQTDLVQVREAMHAHLQAASGVRIDYATIVDPHTMAELSQSDQPEMVAIIAATVGETRLIDNLPITRP